MKTKMLERVAELSKKQQTHTGNETTSMKNPTLFENLP